MSKNIWYDSQKLQSYNGLVNMVLSHRGGGKTYGFILNSIKKHLKNTDYRCLYARRYKGELKKSKNTFFTPYLSQGLFEGHTFEIKGDIGYIDGNPFVHFVSISTALKEKSVSYAYVEDIIYDEFLADGKVVRYFPTPSEEVDNFFQLYETVNRMREADGRKPCKCWLLANSMSISNPYFELFNFYPRRDEDGNLKRFYSIKDGQLIVEFYSNEEFKKAKKETRIGKLLEGTRIGRHMIDNEFYNDSDEFINPKRPKGLQFKFALRYNDKVYGVWVNPSDEMVYIDNKYDCSSTNIFALTKNDHTRNTFLIQSLKTRPQGKYLKLAYTHCSMEFKDNNVKVAMYEILEIMGIK